MKVPQITLGGLNLEYIRCGLQAVGFLLDRLEEPLTFQGRGLRIGIGLLQNSSVMAMHKTCWGIVLCSLRRHMYRA